MFKALFNGECYCIIGPNDPVETDWKQWKIIYASDNRKQVEAFLNLRNIGRVY